MNWYIVLPGGEIRKAENMEEFYKWNEQCIDESVQNGFSSFKNFLDGGKRVSLTEMTTPGGVILNVSTVFLAMDHGFGGEPVLFETMVHSGEDGFMEFQWRYRTYQEAVAGHDKVVQAIKDGKNINELEQ